MRRAAAVLLALALLLTAGCSSKSKVSGPLRYDMERAPATLDPQFAVSDSSLLVVTNAFEGLTRLSGKGEVEPACAERWTLSEGGKVYTFALREGLKWSDGSALTAHDFEFAFRRMFDPAAPSPSAETFLGIDKAAEVLAGVLPASSLGVSALDDLTLRIALAEADPSLPARLAQSGAMPCSGRFFVEQKGRYGLSAESILCNGPFSVADWSADQLSLRRNEHYRTPPDIGGVNLYVGRGDAVSLFLEGRSDLCVIPYHRLSDAGDIQGDWFFDQTWGLLFHLDGEVGSDWGLRAALLGALGEESTAARLPEGLTKARGLIPPSAMLDSRGYREQAGEPRPAPPLADPRGLFLSSLERLGLEKLPRMTLLVGDFSPNPELGGAMQRVWQRELSAHINMEQLSYDELTARVARGNFDLALLPMPAQGNRPEDYLAAFAGVRLSRLESAIPFSGAEVLPPAEGPPEPPGDQAQGEGLSDGAPRIGDLLDAARGLAEPDEAARAFLAVEQRLIDGWCVLPIYDAPSFFAQRTGVTGAVYTAASRAVYFADAAYVQ